MKTGVYYTAGCLRLIAQQLEEEQALVRLQALCWPDDFDAMVSEADRRHRESCDLAISRPGRAMTWAEALSQVGDLVASGDLP